jgi:hypothetical protein
MENNEIKELEDRLNFLANICQDKSCSAKNKCSQCPIKQEYAAKSAKLMILLPITVKEFNDAKADEAVASTKEIKNVVARKKRNTSAAKWRETASSERLADGLCSKCGKNPIYIKSNGKPSKICEACATKAREYQKKLRQNAK